MIRVQNPCSRVRMMFTATGLKLIPPAPAALRAAKASAAMLPRKKRSRSSTPLWWASASAVISSRFTLALLPHARTDVVFAVRLRETLHRCSKFGLGSVPPCGSTAPSKQRQPALGQLSSAQSNPFMTFEIGAAILLLQGQRQVAKLRKAAVQRGSSDLVDATPITSGSDAQEAPFASSGVWRNQSRIRAAAQPAVSALRCDCEILEPESSHSAGHTRLTRQQRMQVLKA